MSFAALLRSRNSLTCSFSAKCLANVVSKTCVNPRTSRQNTSTRRRICSGVIASFDKDTDAASDARDCGAIDTTGTFLSSTASSEFVCRKLRTSVCDCSVISTDSADVIQPLWCGCERVQVYIIKHSQDAPTRKTIVQANLRLMQFIITGRRRLRRHFIISPTRINKDFRLLVADYKKKIRVVNAATHLCRPHLLRLFHRCIFLFYGFDTSLRRRDKVV